MKKSLSAFTVFMLSILIYFSSCEKADNPATTLSSQILGKWIVTEAIGSYTDYGVNRKDTTRYSSDDYFDFHADSTLSIVVEGATHNGRWQIANSKLIISDTRYMDRPRGLELPVLTNTDLQLYYTETHADSYLEQKLNLRR